MMKNLMKRVGVVGVVLSVGVLTGINASNIDITKIRTVYKEATAYQAAHCMVGLTFENTVGDLSDSVYNGYNYVVKKNGTTVGFGFPITMIDQSGVLKNLGGKVSFINLEHRSLHADQAPLKRIEIGETAVINVAIYDTENAQQKTKERSLTCNVPKLDPKLRSPKVKEIKKPTLNPAVDLRKVKPQ